MKIMGILDRHTIASWGSLAVRMLGYVLLIPLATVAYSPEDLVVWFLLTSLTSLQVLLDLGFSPTFSRYYSMAFAGVTIKQVLASQKWKGMGENQLSNEAEVNQILIGQLINCSRSIYKKLSISCVLLLLVGMPWLLAAPIQKSSNSWDAAIASAAAIAAVAFSLYGNRYHAFLAGAGRISESKFGEMIFYGAGLVSGAIALSLGCGIAAAIVSQHIWSVVLLIYLRTRAQQNENYVSVAKSAQSNELGRSIWSQAWRSGVGVALSFGVVQISGFAYAQMSDSNMAAKYLLHLRLIQALSTFAQVPFYTKLPQLSGMFVKGRTTELLAVANKALSVSLWVFTLGALLVTAIGQSKTPPFKGAVQFDALLWGLLSVAIFVERTGAAYVQLHSLTGRIYWHIINGLTGGVILVMAVISYPSAKFYTFPLSLLVANLVVYTPAGMVLVARYYSVGAVLTIIKNALPSLVALLLIVASSVVFFN